MTLPPRFWSKVEKDGPNGCWIWTGHVGANGYGRFKADLGQTTLAHRLAFEDVRGPVPEGLQLDHLCRTRPCVNPAHLEPVTQQENIRRGLRNGNTAKTHCNRGHELTPENTYYRVNRGERSCRTCRRIDGRRYSQEHRDRVKAGTS